LGIFRLVSTQEDAHDVAAISLDDASSHNSTRDLPNPAQVVSEATILASRKIDKKIEDWFWKVPPERFEQRIERTMVERVDAVWVHVTLELVDLQDTHKRLSYMRVTGFSELSSAPKSKSNPAVYGVNVTV
jgi:hypothetical protein